MRIKSNIHELQPDCPGKAELICDNLEDLWHLYNIIAKGDFIKTTTFRKIAHETGSGKSSSTKKKIVITIKVEEIEYDQNEGLLRFKGKNVSENEFISIGQYQAIEIGKGVFFSIFKKFWDEYHIERLKLATDPQVTSDLAAVVMEEGVAHIYLISSHITTLKTKIEQTIQKKRKGPSGHDKSLATFFQKVMDAIAKNINFEVVKCIIIASPGFTKDQFGDYMTNTTSNNKNYDTLHKNLNKFVYVHSSSGYKQALQEVLSKPDIMMQIKNTKANEDIVVMEKFNEILGKDMDRIIFGLKAVEIADERQAFDTLIVTDDYLRKISPFLRQKVTKIMKNVKEKGGSVIKMSSQHVTGEKVDSFGGIVGILKYSIPELTEVDTNQLEDITEENEETQEEDRDTMMMLENCMKDMQIESEEDDDTNQISSPQKNSTAINRSEHSGHHLNKGKPSKLQQKERENVRKAQMRKKSGMDDEI